MALKPTEFRFQVAANGGSAQVNITYAANPVWSGNLAQTVPNLVPGHWDNDTTPVATAACSIDTPEVVDNTPEQIDVLVTLSVTEGDVCLVGINQTNNPTWVTETDPQYNPPTRIVYAGGSPDFDDVWDIVTQPLWNGQALLDRYNIDDNFGKTGPGTVYIKNGETCEFTARLWQYCPVIL